MCCDCIISIFFWIIYNYFKMVFFVTLFFFYLTMTLQLLFTFLIFSFWILPFFKDEIFFKEFARWVEFAESAFAFSPLIFFICFKSGFRIQTNSLVLFIFLSRKMNDLMIKLMEFFFLKFMLLGFNGFLKQVHIFIHL